VEPLSTVSDKNGMVWVLCIGGFDEDFPVLLKIDPVSDQVVKTFTFSTKSDYPDNLQIDEVGENLYFLNNDLYKMHINDSIMLSVAHIPAHGRLIYGLGLDPFTGHIYLSDAI